MRDAADQLAAKRAEDDEHEQVDGGDLAAHLIRRDALDRGVLRHRGRQRAHPARARHSSASSPDGISGAMIANGAASANRIVAARTLASL